MLENLLDDSELLLVLFGLSRAQPHGTHGLSLVRKVVSRMASPKICSFHLALLKQQTIFILWLHRMQSHHGPIFLRNYYSFQRIGVEDWKYTPSGPPFTCKPCQMPATNTVEQRQVPQHPRYVGHGIM